MGRKTKLIILNGNNESVDYAELILDFSSNPSISNNMYSLLIVEINKEVISYEKQQCQ